MYRFLEGRHSSWVNLPCNDIATTVGDLLDVSSPDLEGLPDRWIKIVEGRAKWGHGKFYKVLLDDPVAHCVKEGLWEW